MPEVREALAAIRAGCEVIALTVEIHESGLASTEKYDSSFYGSLTLAAAAQAKCRTVYSEDMHDGQVVPGVTIRDPFRFP